MNATKDNVAEKRDLKELIKALS